MQIEQTRVDCQFLGKLVIDISLKIVGFVFVCMCVCVILVFFFLVGWGRVGREG